MKYINQQDDIHEINQYNLMHFILKNNYIGLSGTMSSPPKTFDEFIT